MSAHELNMVIVHVVIDVILLFKAFGCTFMNADTDNELLFQKWMYLPKAHRVILKASESLCILSRKTVKSSFKTDGSDR